MIGKFLQGRPRVHDPALAKKIFVARMMTRDLFTIVNLVYCYKLQQLARNWSNNMA